MAKLSLSNGPAVVGTVLLLLVFPVRATAQSTSTPGGGPAGGARTPDGQPDLRGVWLNSALVNLTAIYSYDPEAPAPQEAYPGFTNLKASFKPIIVEPADGKIPYHPWARERRQQLYRAAFEPKSLQELDPQGLCIPNGMPRLLFQGSFQIFQLPGYVIFAYEWAHQYRVIPLDGRPHLTDKIKLFVGDSRGRWEGNTLVVNITNNNGRNWLSVAGDFHSDAFKLVERWTRLGPDSMQYEATIEDPNVYTRPWKIRADVVRRTDNYQLLEEPCYEGNHAFPELRSQAAGRSR